MTTLYIKKRTTYRLTSKLDSFITEQSKALGISKNAFVQLTLTKALQPKESGVNKELAR